MKTTLLAMTESRHKAVFTHLFPGDGLEAAAILFVQSRDGERISSTYCFGFIVSAALSI